MLGTVIDTGDSYSCCSNENYILTMKAGNKQIYKTSDGIKAGIGIGSCLFYIYL